MVKPNSHLTGVGTVPVAIPKLRKSTYFPAFLEPRCSADKSMIAVIQEAYLHGISTRSVDDLCPAACNVDPRSASNLDPSIA